MARKAKFITSVGTLEFEKDINLWLSENESATIISIDHCTTDTKIPLPAGKTMMAHSISALIVFETKEPEDNRISRAN